MFTLRFFWHFVNEALFHKRTATSFLSFLWYRLSAVKSYVWRKKTCFEQKPTLLKISKGQNHDSLLDKNIIWNMATALIKGQPSRAEELERLSETSLAFVKEALSLEENGLESSVSCLHNVFYYVHM